MIDNLKNWIDENKLTVDELESNIFEIKEVGKFLLIEAKDDKIIGSDFDFLLSEEEYDRLDVGDIKYILFQFGGFFYYSELKTDKNQYNELYYKASFNRFKSLGKISDDLGIDFVNLGVHSEYELLNGSSEATDWIKKAKFLGHDSLGICDKNTMGGTLPLQIACDKAKIKPIFGETVTVAYSFDEKSEVHNTFDLKLYVKNKKGWRNLLKINKAINVDYDNFQFVPEEILLECGEGLIAVFPRESYFNEIKEDKKAAINLIKLYEKTFDDLYYQIDSVEFESDKIDAKNLDNIKTYIKDYKSFLKPVLINDCFYIEKSDYGLKDYLNKIKKVNDYSSLEQYYKSTEETWNKFISLNLSEEACSVIEKAFLNTRNIANECNYKIEVGTHKLPKFDAKDAVKLFYDLIAHGVENKIIGKVDNEDIYFERIKEECDVIVGANFTDYFLINWDIVKSAKDKGIMVGTGRGSVVGSLVAYLLDITTVDPIPYNLLFERFLNKTRISGERAKSADSMPDVDLDFQASRREEVKDYIGEKYTLNNVCSVGTYNRMKLKSALKGFSKVKGIDYDVINKVTKEINDWEENWEDLFMCTIRADKSKEKWGGNPLRDFIQKHADICNLMQPIIGQASVASVHASAVLILPDRDSEGNKMTMFEWMPVKKVQGQLISEWEGKFVERAGFLKEDILGLQQLDKFQYVLKEIKKNYNKKVVLESIAMNDRPTYKLFMKGYNEDVFQFNSSGLKNYCTKALPDNIEDIIAINALYRPGPMESKAHEHFALIKHGKKKAEYDYGMEVVTKNTFGLFVYQEQIMQAMVVGGLSLVDADIVRTAIKKFDQEAIAKFREKFVEGYAKLILKKFGKKDISKKESEKVWNKLLAFSGYGFNKSHSTAYGVMAYWSQWFKANYPLEFWTTALQFAKQSDKDNEIPSRLSELNKLKLEISIKPPDVNKSDIDFQSDKKSGSIYWSLLKIKGAGEVAVKFILEGRKESPYKSFKDFLGRVPKNKVNKRVVTSLILAGCFDEVERLKDQLGRKELLIEYFTNGKYDIPEDITSPDSDKIYFWIFKQKELTGFGDIDYADILRKKNKKMALKYISSHDFFKKNQDYKEVTIAGKLLMYREGNSKNGKWATLTLESNNNIVQVMFWADMYAKHKKEIPDMKGKVIVVSGKIKWDTWRNTNVLFSTEETTLLVL